MTQRQEHEGGRPAVGNVLGFSLLLRDRKALLRLERRALAPGLRLLEYQAEIPGVEFPLRPQGAAAYRHRRCRVQHLRLEVELHAVQRWLRERIVGRVVHGLRIDELELELAAAVEPEGVTAPRVRIRGHREGRPQWLMVVLRLAPRGRKLAISPWRWWWLGEGSLDLSALWRSLAATLGGEADPDDPDARVLDVVRTSLLRPFVAAGWRVPDLTALTVGDIELRRERASLGLLRRSEGAPAAPVPPSPPAAPDRLRERLDEIRTALASGRRAEAGAALEQLADALPDLHPARLEVLRWLVRAENGHDPTRRLRALQSWLHLAPGDEQAGFALLVALHREGQHGALARRLAAQCRLPHAPRRQARLELALASVLVDHLDERRAGRGLLELLQQRCDADPELEPLRPWVGACLARAMVDRPHVAAEALHRALGPVDRTATRADLQAGVAAAFDRSGQPSLARALWLEVVSAVPDDPELVEQALASAKAADDAEGTAQLLRLVIPVATPARALTLRRALVDALLRSPDESRRELAVAELRALVREQPQSRELAMQLSELERHHGNPERAATVLERVVSSTSDAADRARLRLEQARLRVEDGQPRRAWASLRPALEEAPPELQPELLELAITIAPLTERDALLDRLIELDPGPRSGRALLERARGRSSASKKRADLELAAARLPDPRPALIELARLVGDDEVEVWHALADAEATHGDRPGERLARIEAALRHVARTELDAAREQIIAALASAPRDGALMLMRAWIDVLADRFEEATPQLLAAVVDPPDLEAPPLSDPRLQLPRPRVAFEAEVARRLAAAERPADAATVLHRAIEEQGVAAVPELAQARLEALEAVGDREAASTLAAEIAGLHHGERRAQWLLRAARHATPPQATAWLSEAVRLQPSDPELLLALEAAAAAAGDEARLVEVWNSIADDSALPASRRAQALRALLARRESAGPEDEERLELYARLLRVDPDDLTALLASAEHDRRQGKPERAAIRYSRALPRLPEDDPRRTEPSLWLARHELERDRPDVAQRWLTPLLDRPDTPQEALTLLAEIGRALDDPATRLRAARAMLVRYDDPIERAHAELSLAQLLGELDRAAEALPHAESATELLPSGSAEHVDAARAWLVLALEADDVAQQAAARAALREGLGDELSSKERRAEITLLLERTGQTELAAQLVEEALAHDPADEELLELLERLTQGRGEVLPYLVALEAGIETTTPGPVRDRLAAKLAAAAAEDGDAARVHRAVERLSEAAAASQEMFELRLWSVRRLGLEDDELRRIDVRLSSGRFDASTITHLRRVLGEDELTVVHLLDLARGAEAPIARRLVEPALELAETLGDPSVILRVARQAIRVQAFAVAERAWPHLLGLVSTVGDDAALADLVALADDAREAGMRLDDRLDRLLDAALAHQPASTLLHRALSRHVARTLSDPGTLHERLLVHLDAVADRYELPGRDRADLFIGVAEPLDRSAAAELLAARALQYLEEPDAFGRLLEELEGRQCWPEVLRLLGARAEAAIDPLARVATLKHLAHVAAEVLGDSAAAVQHLEAALELSPTDPDLLLALLDHHYSQTDLSRAIELTERVLEHVRMGDAAFAALAHRAADAAIAQGRSERAETLLQRVLARIPADEKARSRLAELHERAHDPSQRVQLLAAVAARQSGKARLEALEERARLLIEPLGRPLEAMEDLAAVADEAPEREASVELLTVLYREHQRYADLVALLEAGLPRRHGLARARVLRQLAALHRDELLDPARAERALRLAIDELGSGPEEQPLAHELRQELVANLEAQGRYVDLSIYLEQELAPELDAAAPAEPPAAPRLALLQTMARIAREHLGDEARAARLYERLERWHALPDDGLATLARWYGRTRRHEDLVRVLQLRAVALPEHSDRRAAVDLRIAELLDGPLARPHEAAPYYLDAYLADPEANVAAGARARVLLSAVDSVINVRTRLLRRLDELDRSRQPALLTLLADILAPHEEHEQEAESRYREAIELDGSLAGAHDGLGRLLARLGRAGEAARVLSTAAANEGLAPTRAAEAAALAARNFMDLEQYDEAERVLKQALHRSRDSQRALLELARLYEQQGRRTDLASVLDELAELPLSSTMLAEVAYRRALQLRSVYERVPTGPQGERARSHLLEALGANPRHAAARQALLALATARREWSIVAHMHYLAIRDLPPGPRRALVHLDLAATYLDHMGDADSALRNIESALQQAATDVVVGNRTAELARRMPDRRDTAERFERIASGTNELDDAARARLWLLAADLRMEDDDREAAEAASRRVLDLPSVPDDATAAATRTLERLEPRDSASLFAESSGVLARLEEQPEPEERAQLLGRLHDLGKAMGDDALVERASEQQRALAADLDEGDAQAPTTSALLRDLLTARGEYGPVVELYQRLATQAGHEDPVRAAAVLVEAAGYAWRGQSDPAQAAQLLTRALQLQPHDEAATRALAELTQEITDPLAAAAVARALERIPADVRPPAVVLQLAALASTRGAELEALALVRPLTSRSQPEAVRFEALGRLEALLAARGEEAERRRVLEEYLALAVQRADPAAGDVALELARLQRAEGDRAAARRTCETARQAAPEHRELLRMLADLTTLDEDWAALVPLCEALAQLATDDHEQCHWLNRAARLWLDHPELAGRGDPTQQARRLLLRACEIDADDPEPRVTLLPLAFHQARWDEVLALADELVRRIGSDDEVLVLAALAQAYRRGGDQLAREIGFRHTAAVTRRLVLPGLQHTLTEVAMRGPLPRLDDLLSAASALVGGRAVLFHELQTWTVERPPEPGLALGLARLLEARGAGELARNQYQLAAFLAPRGPVPTLVSRLPTPRISGLDLHLISTAPMESRSILREVLAALREHLAGLGTAGSPLPAPPHRRAPSWWSSRMELAETIVEPWRALLGVDLPLAWTDVAVPGGVAVRNDRPPRVILSAECSTLDRPELAFRLGCAAATVALGLAALEGGSLPLVVLLDALGQLANPAHRPTGREALMLADVLAAREARTIGLNAAQRAGLLDELAHWLTSEGGLRRLAIVLHRARLLLACRLSGHFDGALMALARDHDGFVDGRLDTSETLRLDDTHWLLRALSLR